MFIKKSLMLFNQVTFNTLRDAAMPMHLHLPPTSVGGGSIEYGMCTLVLTARFFG